MAYINGTPFETEYNMVYFNNAYILDTVCDMHEIIAKLTTLDLCTLLNSTIHKKIKKILNNIIVIYYSGKSRVILKFIPCE